MENEKGFSLKGKEVWLIFPTYDQARNAIWGPLKEVTRDFAKRVHENTMVITLHNGRTIRVKGADRPDTLRGVGLSFVVLDEFATMKPEVWDEIIRPTLSDVGGKALFIGTPQGRNHFFNLYEYAKDEANEGWEAFTYESIENPFIDHADIKQAKKDSPPEIFRQEYCASFEESGIGELDEVWLDRSIRDKEPEICKEGMWFVVVDLAGFADPLKAKRTKSALRALDETAIAKVCIHPKGAHVKEIQTGRWDARKCATKILLAARDIRTTQVGIEKGSLKNAVEPYLEDKMAELGLHLTLTPLSHGGKNKTERVLWALAGRFRNKKITIENGGWVDKFRVQYVNFPDPRVHDDMVDALAYAFQMSSTGMMYAMNRFYAEVDEDWEPMCSDSGY